MNRITWGVLAGAVVMASQGTARAGDPAAAQALFQQARAEAAAGKYDVACPRFEESFRLDPQVGTLLNLGDCDERLGHIAAALAHFTDAASQLPPNDDRGAYVRDRVARLKARVPRLSIDAASRDPMTVLRDQVEVGAAALNLPLPVEPGPHVIVVRAPGHKDGEYRVDLAEGTEQHVRVEPGPPLTGAAAAATPGTGANAAAGGAATTTPAPATATGASEGRGPLPWVVTSVAVAGIGLGAIAGGLALHEASVVKSDCPNRSCVDPGFTSASDAASQGKTWATISTVGFIAGGVAAAVAIYLWVRPIHHGDRAAQAGARSSASLGRGLEAWVVPWGDRDGAGLAAVGAFE